MFHLLMCIWCLLIATISGVAMHPEIKDTQKRYLIKMKLRAITTRSYPSPSVTDQTAGNRLHTPESLWRYYIAFIYIFYSLIWIVRSGTQAWPSGSRFLKYVFKQSITYESTERSDHISFEMRGNQGPLFFFNTIFSWSADQRRAVNRVGVANELAGKIANAGPSCHPLGDGFKTSSDTSLINLHILCRSAHQDAVN